jgi:hypothetical protein
MQKTPHLLSQPFPMFRACLGKMIGFGTKMAPKKGVSRTTG